MGIFDKNHQGALQRAHLSDAFGALRSDGGGPRQAPLAMQYLQQQREQEKLQQALAQAKQGGLPMGMNPQAFEALSLVDPRQALGMLTQPEAQPDPWRDYKVVGNEVVKAGPDGVSSVYSAPSDTQTKARSALAKLAQDFKDGLIDRETYEKARAKALRDPSGITIGPDGTVSIGGPAPTAIKTEAIKGRNAYDSIMTGLDDFEELVQSGGGAVLPGVRKDAMDETRRALQLQMKELFNLGVLNGPDLALMDQLLVDPTDLLNNAMDMTGIASIEERNKANVARLRKMMTDLIEPKLRSAGQPATSAAQPSARQPQGPRQTINGVTYEQRNGKWGIVQ